MTGLSEEGQMGTVSGKKWGGRICHKHPAGLAHNREDKKYAELQQILVDVMSDVIWGANCLEERTLTVKMQ